VGNTTFFGEFDGYGYSTTVSGTAQTNTSCSTTFLPPTESTLTTYHRVNYTIAMGERALYLLSCTQEWKPTMKGRSLAAVAGALDGAAQRDSGTPEAIKQKYGAWTVCPAFGIGDRYRLTVNSTSDALLQDSTGRISNILEYLRSASLSPLSASKPTSTQAAGAVGEAKVHITSSPSGGEIYVDGKFFGNTPSDITLPVAEHSMRVALGSKEWTRSVQITVGDIHIDADLLQSASPPGEGMQGAKSQDSSQVVAGIPPGWIGVTTKRAVEGAKVTAVVPSGPADEAGIQVGDVIQQLNGTIIKDQDFESELANFKPGTKVLVSYMRSAWAHDTLVTVGKNSTAK
jgi:hypothetical protein